MFPVKGRRDLSPCVRALLLELHLSARKLLCLGYFQYIVEVPVIDCDLSTPPPKSENELFYDVVANGLQVLARVTLNNSYKKFVNDEFVPPNSDVAGSSGGTNRISCELIGIGDRKLWWGEPDACVRPLESDTLHSNSTLIIATTLLDEDTDGESSQVEAKQQLTHAHLPQRVATAIVHSFTQNKRHPGLNPMVPTVPINGSDFRIILYDCSKDVLLVSNPVEYRDGSKMTPLGTLVLWLTIHHRKFVGEFKKDSPFVFGLKECAEKNNLLHSFKELKETRVGWRLIKKETPEEEATMIVNTPEIEFKPFIKQRASRRH